MSDATLVQTKDSSANPAPLGLLAFGMTTVLLNLHNAGFFELNSMILAMGLCYGGAAQIIAGIMEWRKNNTFGMVAFLSYGFFWWSLALIVLLPTFFPGLKTTEPAMGWYFVLWGLFTLGLFVGTFRANIALQIVFGTLTILFALLAAKSFCTLGPTFAHWTGYEGVLCGVSACYTGLAGILNELYNRTILPVGPVTP